jgi:hypothetical protein
MVTTTAPTRHAAAPELPRPVEAVLWALVAPLRELGYLLAEVEAALLPVLRWLRTELLAVAYRLRRAAEAAARMRQLITAYALFAASGVFAALAITHWGTP